jgi:nicotinamidase-related amidase
MRIDLLVIDPQIDFCQPGGALYVPNAENDMTRLATMVKRLGKKIDKVHVTLDSHHLVDIAHPIWWRNSKGDAPSPFTIITAQEVKNGTWTTRQPSQAKRSLEYLEALETGGRYPLCIWPPHCLIGSAGHAVAPVLYDALREWESSFRLVEYVTKGSNIYTEHYSAISAEVPDPSDPSTHLNVDLINTLEEADILLVGGEAGSHCVANTLKDIRAAYGNDDKMKRIVLLEDAMSPVPNFEQLQSDFFAEMKQAGVQFSRTTDYLK